MSRELDKVLGHVNDMETKQTIKSFADSLFVVMEKSVPYCTDFLSPIEIKYCITLMNTFGFTDYYVYPGKDNCERNVIVLFGPYYKPEADEYVSTLEFETPEGINHRDVLGSLLSLGITRNKVGDIVFTDSKTVFFIRNTIKNFLESNFFKVKNQNISISEIKDFDFSEVSQSYNKKSMVVSSLRLDTICSGIMNVSRNKASEKVTRGDVKLNYTQNTKVHEVVEDESIISIRGFGRYKILGTTGRTKKDNYVVEYLKYL